jgi:hypothetical protein
MTTPDTRTATAQTSKRIAYLEYRLAFEEAAHHTSRIVLKKTIHNLKIQNNRQARVIRRAQKYFQGIIP